MTAPDLKAIEEHVRFFEEKFPDPDMRLASEKYLRELLDYVKELERVGRQEGLAL